MTTEEIETVRNDELMLATLEVLSENPHPVPRAQVLEEIRRRFDFTPYELAPTGKNGNIRWRVHLSWMSTDLKSAGWLTKDSDGWQITPEGLAALDRYRDDPAGMRTEAMSAYREQNKAKGDGEQKYRNLDAALDLLEDGQWTSYSDLAAVVGTNAQTVGWYMSETDRPNAYRVLNKNGTPSANFRWKDGRTDSVVDVLRGEGLAFDDSGHADESKRLRAGDFREFLEQQGLLQRVPKRAWFVRGSSVGGMDMVPTWVEQGFVSLRASQLREVDPDVSWSDLKEVVNEDYASSRLGPRRPRNSTLSCRGCKSVTSS